MFADRLDAEFSAPSELLSAPYEAIRLTDAHSAKRLREIDTKLVTFFIFKAGSGETLGVPEFPT